MLSNHWNAPSPGNHHPQSSLTFQTKQGLQKLPTEPPSQIGPGHTEQLCSLCHHQLPRFHNTHRLTQSKGTGGAVRYNDQRTPIPASRAQLSFPSWTAGSPLPHPDHTQFPLIPERERAPLTPSPLQELTQPRPTTRAHPIPAVGGCLFPGTSSMIFSLLAQIDQTVFAPTFSALYVSSQPTRPTHLSSIPEQPPRTCSPFPPTGCADLHAD